MPLYEYQCESCGRRTETLQRMSDPPLTVCPHCGGALRKLFSAPSFQLKGSGWYATDYAKKSGGDDRKGKGGADDAVVSPAASSGEGASSTSASSPASAASSDGAAKSGDGGGSSKPASSKATE